MNATFALAFSLTVGLELLGMGVACRLLRLPPRRALIVCLVVNTLAHPTFWFTFPALPLAWPASLYAAEALVVLAEAAAYWRLIPLRPAVALAVSATLNFVSYLAGTAL